MGVESIALFLLSHFVFTVIIIVYHADKILKRLNAIESAQANYYARFTEVNRPTK